MESPNFNSLPEANDDLLLCDVSRVIRAIWLDQSDSAEGAQMGDGVASSENGGRHHPDALAVLAELRRRHHSSASFSDFAIKTAYLAVLRDRRLMGFLKKVTQERPEIVSRVLGDIRSCSPSMTIADGFRVWAKLAHDFPDNAAYCFDPNQIHNAARTVRAAQRSEAFMGAGCVHAGDPDVRALAMQLLAEELGLEPARLKSLNLDDFNPYARTVNIHIRGRRSPVELSTPTCDAIERWVLIRPQGQGLLFCDCHPRRRRESCASEAVVDFARSLSVGAEPSEQVVVEDLIEVFFDRITPNERQVVLRKLMPSAGCSESLIVRLRSRAAADGTVAHTDAAEPLRATPKTIRQRERRMLQRIELRWNDFLKSQDNPKKRGPTP